MTDCQSTNVSHLLLFQLAFISLLLVTHRCTSQTPNIVQVDNELLLKQLEALRHHTPFFLFTVTDRRTRYDLIRNLNNFASDLKRSFPDSKIRFGIYDTSRNKPNYRPKIAKGTFKAELFTLNDHQVIDYGLEKQENIIRFVEKAIVENFGIRIEASFRLHPALRISIIISALSLVLCLLAFRQKCDDILQMLINLNLPREYIAISMLSCLVIFEQWPMRCLAFSAMLLPQLLVKFSPNNRRFNFLIFVCIIILSALDVRFISNGRFK
ncbi:MAG: hypothetical protein MHMPM18_000533 [Marteilia pararefringens]